MGARAGSPPRIGTPIPKEKGQGNHWYCVRMCGARQTPRCVVGSKARDQPSSRKSARPEQAAWSNFNRDEQASRCFAISRLCCAAFFHRPCVPATPRISYGPASYCPQDVVVAVGESGQRGGKLKNACKMRNQRDCTLAPSTAALSGILSGNSPSHFILDKVGVRCTP